MCVALVPPVQDAYTDPGPWEQLRDWLAAGALPDNRCTSPGLSARWAEARAGVVPVPKSYEVTEPGRG